MPCTAARQYEMLLSNGTKQQKQARRTSIRNTVRNRAKLPNQTFPCPSLALAHCTPSPLPLPQPPTLRCLHSPACWSAGPLISQTSAAPLTASPPHLFTSSATPLTSHLLCQASLPQPYSSPIPLQLPACWSAGRWSNRTWRSAVPRPGARSRRRSFRCP